MKPWAPNSLKFMKYLESRVAEATGEKYAISFMFQSLSMNQAEWLACRKSRDPILNAVLLFSKTVC